MPEGNVTFDMKLHLIFPAFSPGPFHFPSVSGGVYALGASCTDLHCVPQDHRAHSQPGAFALAAPRPGMPFPERLPWHLLQVSA